MWKSTWSVNDQFSGAIESRDNKMVKLIYRPEGTPFISDFYGSPAVFAKYKINGKVLTIQLDFMNWIFTKREEELANLTPEQLGEILLDLLKSYDTFETYLPRGRMFNETLASYINPQTEQVTPKRPRRR